MTNAAAVPDGRSSSTTPDASRTFIQVPQSATSAYSVRSGKGSIKTLASVFPAFKFGRLRRMFNGGTKYADDGEADLVEMINEAPSIYHPEGLNKRIRTHALW